MSGAVLDLAVLLRGAPREMYCNRRLQARDIPAPAAGGARVTHPQETDHGIVELPRRFVADP